MRVLGIGDYNDLGFMYHRLQAEGHEVKVFIADREARGVMAGIVPHTDDWQGELPWVREAGSDGLVLFENMNMGPVQDELRRQGFPVVGGSGFGDRLETDRAFGQRIMAGIGLKTAESHRFTSFEEAIAFLDRTPRRTVFKLNGTTHVGRENFVGELGDGSDMRAFLRLQRRRWAEDPQLRDEVPDFILMDHVSGVEMGVGAYFDGRRFLEPACLDWEHKRFFPGDLGELTGEMGTLVTYEGTDRFFAATLKRMAPLLADGGYIGYINLNTIVNEKGIWPLEFTGRFGYPGSAILGALQQTPWSQMLRWMASSTSDEQPRFDTLPGYAVGIVLTAPPFPYRGGYQDLSRGMPLLFRTRTLDEALADSHFHWGEVALERSLDAPARLVASGPLGYLGVATGTGPTVEAAQVSALARARDVVLPGIRYRQDIGDRFISRDCESLRNLGWL